jgi:hypothetical protein
MSKHEHTSTQRTWMDLVIYWMPAWNVVYMLLMMNVKEAESIYYCLCVSQESSADREKKIDSCKIAWWPGSRDAEHQRDTASKVVARARICLPHCKCTPPTGHQDAVLNLWISACNMVSSIFNKTYRLWVYAAIYVSSASHMSDSAPTTHVRDEIWKLTRPDPRLNSLSPFDARMSALK